MHRRRFVKQAALGLGVTGLSGHAHAGPAAQGKGTPAHKGKPAPEFYELRRYSLRIGQQVGIVSDFVRQVLIPTLSRLGVGPVGAFTLISGAEAPSLYVLIPYPSLADFQDLEPRLARELEHDRHPAARAYFEAPASQPAYERLQVQLLAAFPNVPHIEVPAGTRENKPRIFELRIYQQPGEVGHRKKMEMFTPALGELEIFRRLKMTPVFFGRGLTGSDLPSFTYMLVFPDVAARETAWAAFRSDPEWLKLRARDGYADADIMSHITSVLLAPAAGSQL